MTEQSKILVTGTTGKVGREVVSGLLDSGAEVRALTHNPDSAGLPEGVESSGTLMRKGRTAGSVMGVSGWVMAMVVSYAVDRASLGQRSQPSN